MARRKKSEFNIIDIWKSGVLIGHLTDNDVLPSIADKWKLYVLSHNIIQKIKKKTVSKRNTEKETQFLAYRFYGKPTPSQESQLKNNTGACRFLWNRMLSDREYLYEQMGITVNNTPADYKDIPELSWLNEVDSFGLLNVQLNLQRAYSDYLNGDKKHPRYKKKGRCTESYTTNKNNKSNNICLTGNMLKLPKIKEPIRLRVHRKIKPGGTLKSCTITHEPNGKWYFSLLYEYPAKEPTLSERINEFLDTGDISLLKHIGLDMSLPHFYVDSVGNFPSYILNGIVVSFKKQYQKIERRLSQAQRKLSRKKYKSNNYYKQQNKVARMHAKAKHARRDFIEQLSARLSEVYDIITIEDLDMAAIKQSLHFGKSVSDNNWGMFTDRLAEKCEAKGKVLIKVSKWFPSSKKCIACGHVHKELSLSDRTYICPACGHAIDRDKQAAINLDNEGLRIFIEALLDAMQMHPASDYDTQSTGGTPGIVCLTTGRTRNRFGGNVPKKSPVYAEIKESRPSIA